YFSSHYSAHPHALPSFPTRRSSDLGPVTLGREVFVGERSVLDIHTSMGNGAQLGHASALHSGQTVPQGERWHGSPAQRTDVNYLDRKSTRLNSSHLVISYAVFCLKK